MSDQEISYQSPRNPGQMTRAAFHTLEAGHSVHEIAAPAQQQAMQQQAAGYLNQKRIPPEQHPTWLVHYEIHDQQGRKPNFARHTIRLDQPEAGSYYVVYYQDKDARTHQVKKLAVRDARDERGSPITGKVDADFSYGDPMIGITRVDPGSW
jgi:hypothetical protein